MPKFNPPEELNFQKPAWQDWKERFTRFRLATKLNKEEGVVQVSTLIYAMGKEAEKVFKSFTFESDDDKDDYEIVIGKLEEYFIPKINVIFERSKFHKRIQQDSESIEEFVRSLYELSEHCQFQDRHTQIRDRLVIGLYDKHLCEKLQLKEDLTLEKAVEIARNHELIRQQNSEQSISKEIEEMSIKRRPHGPRGVTHKEKGRYKHSHPSSFADRSERTTKDWGASRMSCGRCGTTHFGKTCPATGKTCAKCNKKNHFARVCKTSSQKTRQIAENIDTGIVNDDFIGTVEEARGDSVSESAWHATLLIEDKPVNFKIDTGADVTVMPRHIFNKLNLKRKLHHTNNILQSPAGKLQTDGCFIQPVTYKGKIYNLRIFVINTKSPHCLLSRQASERMNLVARINEVNIPQTIFANAGRMKTKPVKIEIREDAESYSTAVPRRIPIPLLPKVKEELERMMSTGTIEEVTEPTEWCAPKRCAPIVIVPKAAGDKIRLCVDLTKLNKAVKRERYTLPTVDDIAHKLAGAKHFSRLDCASGFWQIPLEESSAKLTTFITPFGRYFFKVLPFGITSASEIFQRKMKEILKDCDGSDCFIDDIIFGNTQQEHDKRLNKVLKVLENAGLRLNKEKCEFRKREIKFLGFKVNQEGMVPDEEKITAVQQLEDPKNVSELKSILGVINFLGRHVPNLSTTLKPLYDLLKKDNAWYWGPYQKDALDKIKMIITNAPVLAFYDPLKPTIVTADSSSYGIGGAILQKHGEQIKPVAYCSRTLTQAERGYAQIEKETLAAVWACEKFSRFLVGLNSFTLETDHKPIVPLINTKDLDQAPLRCQRLLMRLMRFNPVAVYKPGKDLYLADTLSRKPLQVEDKLLEMDVNAYINSIETYQWDTDLDAIRTQTEEDEEMNQLKEIIERGWPKHKHNVPISLKKYYEERGNLSVLNGLIIKDKRIVIPQGMKGEMLKLIHEGHQGINKCRERAKQSVWWPNINKDIINMVERCKQCEEAQPTNRKETLKPTPLPDRAWQRAAADLFYHKNKTFVVLVDYYSRYMEIGYLPDQRSGTTILKLKSFFARHGIPEILVTDNGPQFSSGEFKQFAKAWRFKHQTTSPHFPQANGQAERAVQTAKKILSQEDSFSALLAYRNSPHTATQFTPSMLSMGRELRTAIPTLPENLRPQYIAQGQAQRNDKQSKARYKKHFDRRYGARDLPPLHPNDQVLIKLDDQKGWTTPAHVISSENAQSPRSYLVDTGTATLRRNRRHIRPTNHYRPRSSTANDLVEWDYDDATTHSNIVSSPRTEEECGANHTTAANVSNNAAAPPPPSPSPYVTRHGRRIVRPARYLQ